MKIYKFLITLSFLEGIAYLVLGSVAQVLPVTYVITVLFALVHLGFMSKLGNYQVRVSKAPVLFMFLSIGVLLCGIFNGQSLFNVFFNWKQLYFFPLILLVFPYVWRTNWRLLFVRLAFLLNIVGLIQNLVGPRWISVFNHSINWRYGSITSFYRVDFLGGVYRVNSTFRDSFNYGDFNAVILMILLLEPNLVGKRSRLVIQILALLGLWWSGSRDSVVLFGVGLFGVYITKIFNRAKLVAWLYAAFCTALPAIYIWGYFVIHKASLIANKGVLSQTSLSNRLLNWYLLVNYAWKPSVGLNFWFGAGVGQTTQVPGWVNPIPIDNFYLDVLIQSGVVGLIVWISFFIWLLRLCINRLNNLEQRLAYVMTCGILTASWFRPELVEFPMQLMFWSVIAAGISTGSLNQLTRTGQEMAHLSTRRYQEYGTVAKV